MHLSSGTTTVSCAKATIMSLLCHGVCWETGKGNGHASAWLDQASFGPATQSGRHCLPRYQSTSQTDPVKQAKSYSDLPQAGRHVKALQTVALP